MSPRDDSQDMGALHDDRLLGGMPVDDEPGLVALVAALRTSAQAPAPRPSAALGALLRDGLPAGGARAGSPARSHPSLVRDTPGPGWSVRLASRRAASLREARRTRRPGSTGPRRTVLAMLRWIAGLGVVGQIGLTAGLAAAAVGGAAGVDVLPDAVQQPAREVVDWVVDAVVPGVPVPPGTGAHPGAADDASAVLPVVEVAAGVGVDPAPGPAVAPQPGPGARTPSGRPAAVELPPVVRTPPPRPPTAVAPRTGASDPGKAPAAGTGADGPATASPAPANPTPPAPAVADGGTGRAATPAAVRAPVPPVGNESGAEKGRAGAGAGADGGATG